MEDGTKRCLFRGICVSRRDDGRIDRQIGRKILSATFLFGENGKCDVDMQEYSKGELCIHTYSDPNI
jgi:hypothetical protein